MRRTVVKNSVPRYAVVAGKPARLLRCRFDSKSCKRLLESRWWEWSDERLHKLKPRFMTDIETFLDATECHFSEFA